MDLTGKAVIITGSSSGIGAAVARCLSGLGAGIVVNSASSAEAGQRIAAELADAVYVQGDVGDPGTAAALVAAADQRWGRLDGLVNRAAAPRGHSRGHHRGLPRAHHDPLCHRPDVPGRRRPRARYLIRPGDRVGWARAQGRR